MAFAERMDSGVSEVSAPAGAGADGLQMHSFGFWQQGVAPGDWSREVIARNLDGEDFKGYRRASDPSHLRESSPSLPEARGAEPAEIVIETGSLVAGVETDQTFAAISRLVASYGEDSARDEIGADALVRSAGADLYELELVDTVAGAARRAGLEGSPMHAAMRGMEAARAVPEDGLNEIGLHRRAADQETGTVSSASDAELFRFDAASQPLIQSADDFLML